MPTDLLPLLALLLALAIPASAVSAGVLTLSSVVHLGGVLVERWLFIAEAKHTVMLYYGAAAA